MSALENEYKYLIDRAMRQHNEVLARDLVIGAMKYDIDLSDYLHPARAA